LGRAGQNRSTPLGGKVINDGGKIYANTSLDPEGIDAGATDPASFPPQIAPKAGAYGALFPGGNLNR